MREFMPRGLRWQSDPQYPIGQPTSQTGNGDPYPQLVPDYEQMQSESPPPPAETEATTGA